MDETASTFEIKNKWRVFGGTLIRFSHSSTETKTSMLCSVYIPSSIEMENASANIPVIYYLSGLTCTDENVCQKGHTFKTLSEQKVAMIYPDTSPRGAGIEGETASWDFGVGAGFYIDAEQQPWAANYRMYSYITKELPSVIERNFPCLNMSRVSIMGHSMGGHGALTIALKNQSTYKSVSALAPICNPSKCPWGVKAFTGYFGAENTFAWNNSDATELMKMCATKASSGGRATTFDSILIDVGTADSFYSNGQLLPEAFLEAAQEAKQHVNLRFQEGYDHSYFFISTVMEDHILFHAQRLKEGSEPLYFVN